MPIEGFDYKAFAAGLASEAMNLLSQKNSNAVPDSVTVPERKIIVETVKKFTYMAGEALSNDPQLKFTAQQATIVAQFIGEWTFHKSVDLMVSKIPQQNRDAILQVIAANIFNTAKLALIKGMPTDNLITLIEEKVNNVYTTELQKLVKKGALSPKQYEMAVNASNLKDFVESNEDQEKIEKMQQNTAGHEVAPTDKKVLKLAALAIILKKLPEEKANAILNSLDKSDARHVLNYARMSDIENKLDHQVIIKSLEEIKKIIPEPETVNVEKILKKYHKTLVSTPPDLLSELAMNERENVRDFILDAKFPAKEVFSPHVIQSLVRSIEAKLNDN